MGAQGIMVESCQNWVRPPLALSSINFDVCSIAQTNIPRCHIAKATQKLQYNGGQGAISGDHFYYKRERNIVLQLE